jgi:mono/diheme cytochrome c family protein
MKLLLRLVPIVAIGLIVFSIPGPASISRAQAPDAPRPVTRGAAWGAKEGQACIQCHGTLNAALVEEWRLGAHGQKGVRIPDERTAHKRSSLQCSC